MALGEAVRSSRKCWEIPEENGHLSTYLARYLSIYPSIHPPIHSCVCIYFIHTICVSYRKTIELIGPGLSGDSQVHLG